MTKIHFFFLNSTSWRLAKRRNGNWTCANRRSGGGSWYSNVIHIRQTFSLSKTHSQLSPGTMRHRSDGKCWAGYPICGWCSRTGSRPRFSQRTDVWPPTAWLPQTLWEGENLVESVADITATSCWHMARQLEAFHYCESPGKSSLCNYFVAYSMKGKKKKAVV